MLYCQIDADRVCTYVTSPSSKHATIIITITTRTTTTTGMDP
jgi:hypothetical protein